MILIVVSIVSMRWSVCIGYVAEIYSYLGFRARATVARESWVGMKTDRIDRIRTDITDIVFVFIFVFEYGVGYG